MRDPLPIFLMLHSEAPKVRFEDEDCSIRILPTGDETIAVAISLEDAHQLALDLLNLTTTHLPKLTQAQRGKLKAID
jgi:hypothetical protein